jgi:hypothetical protein
MLDVHKTCFQNRLNASYVIIYSGNFNEFYAGK